MKTCSIFLKLGLLCLLWLESSSCLRSVGERLAEGVTQEIDSIFFEKTAQVITRGALQELLSDSTQQRLRLNIDSLLTMTGDSLDHLSKRLTANFIGDYTRDWINARADQLSSKLESSLSALKAELLNEDLENYLQHLSRDILSVELKRLSNDLLNELTGEALAGRLGEIRPAIAQELDSIIQASILALAIHSNTHLIPLLDSLTLSTGGVIQQAEDTSKGLIRYLLLGIGSVVFIGFLIAQWIWKNRYKAMLEVLARNIDEVPSQKTYDKLTHSIKKDLENRGLENHMREQILEKQELIDQQEWKDKDAQIFQLIKAELREEEPEEEGLTRSVGPRSPASDFKARLKQRAKELGLEDHLESILHR